MRHGGAAGSGFPDGIGAKLRREGIGGLGHEKFRVMPPEVGLVDFGDISQNGAQIARVLTLPLYCGVAGFPHRFLPWQNMPRYASNPNRETA